MNDETPRTKAASDARLLAYYAGVLLIAGVSVLVGVATESVSAQLLGGVGFFAVLATLPIAWMLHAQVRRGDSNEQLAEAVRVMTSEAGLSDAARRVLHRREERELLTRAITQDISAEDWEAALVLTRELADRFGYRADAEEFRTRIERARAQTQDRRVIEALATLDEQIRAHRWADAYADAARIRRLYPESHRTEHLRARVDEARRRYRQELERTFLLAAQREDVDEAMRLLKELDQYLTPTEAEPLMEVARGVVTKSRENLGVRFHLLIKDGNWQQAVETGEQIVSEFPNTRMAAEVRAMLPGIRDRVAGLTPKA
ncbi:MAG: hypothetical protein AAGD00_07850 [Planctomycetota bacterium]